ncbi:PAS domain S-box protein [Geomesophilobacter sediminis]|uniref:histidine kinase n=1 Tax=Geomesophilobacter sediminis TaxID=2798584 RepID=A0A8J7M0M3_9BACT|nr:PAS domain S-box protein [Geomesophilobacter sediminis]MBJ6725937.1 PAS domain S-box protein [Geomesophilobacter sediminis]
MNNSIFIGLVNNAALLLTLGILYDTFSPERARLARPLPRQAVTGVILGAMAVLLMKCPVVFSSGIIFDTRTILLGLSGFFFPTLSTIIAMALATAYRLHLGGGGAAMGVATIVSAGMLGILWKRLPSGRLDKLSLSGLYLFGIVVHAAMIACMFLLPRELQAKALDHLPLPVIVIYPVITALLGRVLSGWRQRHRMDEELRETTERFSQLARQSRTITWETDTTGLYTHVSPVAESVWGYLSEELVGKRRFHELHGEAGDRYRAEAEAAFARKSSFVDLVTPVRAKSGETVWVSTNAFAVLDEAGTMVGFRGADTDITERLRLQNRLAESELIYRSLFQLSSYGIVIIDVERGTLIDFNDQACRQLGYTREEFRRLKVEEIDILETAADARDRIRKVVSQGSEEFETLQRTKQGEPRNVLVKAQYSVVGGKGIYHCIWQDITKNRREEKVLKARVDLIRFGLSHPLDEVLTRALDQLEVLTDSSISFCHFVSEDQNAVTHSGWSTRTRTLCGTREGALHNPCTSGVWADCVRGRRPLVHNDYAALPDRKGLPDGHPAVVRELAVPIFRSDRVVAVFGVGNRPIDYTDEDLDVVTRFADFAWDVAERLRVEESLRESNERFASAFEHAPTAMAISSIEDSKCININRRFEELFGFTKEEAVGKRFVELGVITAEERNKIFEGIRADGQVQNLELTYHTKGGKAVTINYAGRIIPIGGERRLLSILTDITDHRRMEQQLIQAQKMESVGRLAGGVAHDFNNMLGIIMGRAELALMDRNVPPHLRKTLEEILDAADRSAAITRQLLAFARKQEVQPRVIDLNDNISATLKMLRRLIGEDIELDWHPAQELWRVKIDPTQVDQMLANLCVNARDAIAGVGRLEIRTENFTMMRSEVGALTAIPAGDYVLLSVTDNGSGMSAEVLEHIFEPFFTTKGLGHGTGLGLATVYGILKQNGGHIKVYSEPGEGTTFSIFLPAEKGAVQPQPEKPMVLVGGYETILFVEDEEAIKNLGTAMLTNLGYHVVAAGSPQEALEIAAQIGEVDLLITDIIMPGMNGRDLAERLAAQQPGLKCLFISGYTAEIMAERGRIETGQHFLHKPFQMQALAEKVREVLEA